MFFENLGNEVSSPEIILKALCALEGERDYYSMTDKEFVGIV